MITLRVTFVVDQQNKPEKASKVAGLITDTLNFKDGFEVFKYDKFIDSYKIEMLGKINCEHSVETVIELGDRICTPWLVYYDSDINEAELIFNRDKNSRFRRQNFNVIRWAHISTTK